ncbi:hypothetical protein [Photorhabdus bodei]|uniref:Uncharacterized protein n=1 Tax=Photorhabdus bodei TaxID=2029681 RepID=A0A329WXS4_9GAMM|nr:hypothetical protein [Photorhabdus bodei]NDK99761.1 hypothetical protein [Photorhabdus bodei]NDL04082.1 hypothetical protein [Photorhabdus bodei]NDL08133.1 hypothetical protein [Photorhabdus bodei]RAX08815.1 hypothetical protein CKY02_18100 [Photorhabdus bodei]
MKKIVKRLIWQDLNPKKRGIILKEHKWVSLYHQTIYSLIYEDKTMMIKLEKTDVSPRKKDK